MPPRLRAIGPAGVATLAVMRRRVRIVLLAAVTAVIGGVTACASTAAGQIPPPAPKSAAAASAPARVPVTSSPSRPAVSPQIEVTGAPGHVKAKGAVLADASTGQLLWGRDVDTERPMASVTDRKST